MIEMLASLYTTGRTRLRAWFDKGGRNGVWQVVYLGSLVAATAAALADTDVSIARRAAIAVLAVLAASWYVFITTWRYWEAPTHRFTMAMVVAGALWFPLLVLHPAFGLTTLAAYGLAACPGLRRALPSIVVLTGLILLADVVDGGSGLSAGRVAWQLAIGGVVVLVLVSVRATQAESERRQQLIEELDTTRADLAASERAAGALAERERLARDIHDALAQGFTSIVMLLEAADARLPDGSAEARAPLDQALQTARDSLAEARRVVWALRPADEPGALVASLERLAERSTVAGEVEVDVVVTGAPAPLDPAREMTLLRTAQEAVGNARRHTRATRITVTLSWLGDTVILDVADDGQGFDPQRITQRPGGGLGLTNLTERARQSGGTLTVESTPAEGTTVSLALPLHDTPNASQPASTT